MSNQTPAAETVLRRAVEAAMRRMSTAEPGVIESYNAATCTADVQPLIMRVRADENGDRVVDRAPVVNDVPVLFMGGGGMRLTFPVKRGDLCLLITSSQPLDQWHSSGSETDPKTSRHHHISDSIALVGLTPAYRATAAHAEATVLEGNDIRLGDASAQLLALKSDVDALRTTLNAHVHSGVTTGAGTSGVLVTPVGAMVGTTKTKAS